MDEATRAVLVVATVSTVGAVGGAQRRWLLRRPLGVEARQLFHLQLGSVVVLMAGAG